MAMWGGYNTYGEMIAANQGLYSSGGISNSAGAAPAQQPAQPSLFSTPHTGSPSAFGTNSVFGVGSIGGLQSSGTGILRDINGNIVQPGSPAPPAAPPPPAPIAQPAPYGTNAYGEPLPASSPYAVQQSAPQSPVPQPAPPPAAPLPPPPAQQAPQLGTPAAAQPQGAPAPQAAPLPQTNQQSAIDALLGQITGSVGQASSMEPLIQQLAQQAMQLAQRPSQVGNYTSQVQQLMQQLNSGYSNNDYQALVDKAAASQRSAAYDTLMKQYTERMGGQGLTGTDGQSLQLLTELMSPIERQLLAQHDSDALGAAQRRDSLGTSLISGYGDLMKNEGLAGQLDTQRLSSLSDLAGNLGTISNHPTQARIQALNALLQSQTTGNDLAYKSAMLGNTLQNSALDRQLQQQQLMQTQSESSQRLAQLQQALSQSQQESALRLQQAQQAQDQYNTITKPSGLLALQQAQAEATRAASPVASRVSSGGAAPIPQGTGGMPTGSAAGFAGLGSGGAVGGASGIASAPQVASQVGGGGMYSAAANAEAQRVAAAQAAAHPAAPATTTLGGAKLPIQTTTGNGLQIDGIGGGLSQMAGKPVAQGGAAAWQAVPSLFDYSSNAYYNPANNPWSSVFDSAFDSGGAAALKG